MVLGNGCFDRVVARILSLLASQGREWIVQRERKSHPWLLFLSTPHHLSRLLITPGSRKREKKRRQHPRVLALVPVGPQVQPNPEEVPLGKVTREQNKKEKVGSRDFKCALFPFLGPYLVCTSDLPVRRPILITNSDLVLFECPHFYFLPFLFLFPSAPNPNIQPSQPNQLVDRMTQNKHQNLDFLHLNLD